MSNLTERAIAETFIKLVSEQPLDKITVRQIAAECGISRNTFYYHFHDVYDLLDRLFAHEEERFLSDVRNLSTLQQSFEAATRFVLENEQAVYHIYNSVSRDALTNYLYSVSTICMRNYIQIQAMRMKVDERDFDNLVFLYASMLEGAVINILREGIPRDIHPFIENSVKLLEGTVRLALENSLK